MLRDQPHSNDSAHKEPGGIVPEMYLSDYVQKQLSALHYCDTITIDPHKTGFCPYPAGAICYRDKIMNTFLHIDSEVPYLHGKMVLGNVGIEGSKPGAAAAGVMLANKVMTKVLVSLIFPSFFFRNAVFYFKVTEKFS